MPARAGVVIFESMCTGVSHSSLLVFVDKSSEISFEVTVKVYLVAVFRDLLIIRLMKWEKQERKWLKSSQFVTCDCEGICDCYKFQIWLGYSR